MRLRVFILILWTIVASINSGCMINPFDKAKFDGFYNQSISLEDNLIFYNFNETEYTGSTGDVIDSSGRSRHSTSVNNLEKGRGIYGEGIRCRESDASGVNLEVSEFDGAFDERTISVWFVSLDNSGIRYIYEEGGTTNGINIYIDGGILYGHTYKSNGGDYQLWHTANVTTDKWYHVVIVFDLATGFEMFVNGESVGSPQAISLGMPGHSNPNSLCYLNDDSRRHDAVQSNATGDHPFEGYLDELAVWNRVLSGDEIKNLYLRQGRL